MRRLIPFALLFVLTPLIGAGAIGQKAAQVLFVVHEWGAFTSIAGSDGRAVEWNPQDVTQDLPCFVDRQQFNVKGWMPAKVRMETPVLYFYASSSTTVDVGVHFRQGAITEWYPHAAVTTAAATVANFWRPDFVGEAAWRHVRITPDAAADFPRELDKSHYYAARETDASPVEVDGQREKFLFYRGIGNFEPPLSATVRADGGVTVASTTPSSVGDVILFQNRGGAISYQVFNAATHELRIDAPVQNGESVLPLQELEALLVKHGLYAREAKAMVKTWRDSWFEEGTRLFYVTSAGVVDGILPLDITPKPASLERVFVGRIELLTSTTLRDVTEALAKNDRRLINAYGRFIPSIVSRILESATPADKASINAAMSAVYRDWAAGPARCH
jgi:hypothetical protein